MKRIMLFILAVLLSGCVTTPKAIPVNTYKDSGWGSRTYYSYEFDIISDPPGAKIEWGNDYIGDTPLKRVYNGNFGSLAMIIVKASPTQPNQYSQVKILYGSDVLPRTIYFNMHLKPITPEYNINLNR